MNANEINLPDEKEKERRKSIRNEIQDQVIIREKEQELKNEVKKACMTPYSQKLRKRQRKKEN
jgi:hypothetical protein